MCINTVNKGSIMKDKMMYSKIKKITYNIHVKQDKSMNVISK